MLILDSSKHLIIDCTRTKRISNIHTKTYVTDLYTLKNKKALGGGRAVKNTDTGKTISQIFTIVKSAG